MHHNLSRGGGAETLACTQVVMTRLKLTLNSEKSHASDTLQQDVEIHGGAAPEIQCMRPQKDLC